MLDGADKRTLRRAAIARRKLTTDADRVAAGMRLAAAAEPLIAGLERGATVAAYVSMGSEVEMTPLLHALLDAGMRVLVPMLGRGLDVGWGVLDELDDLADAGERRPQEPSGETLEADALHEAALVILPALSVDRSGTRLGRGGGWYDRALGYRGAGARTVAVCWPWEVVKTVLPHEPHDVPVDAVLTPDGMTPLR
ncbi:5-formyltetrahydrofolate cyclo-ligase [Bifidobacterium aerophilum]|uniref:5-formyltetrahydrofolate cyclo-ligase n=1 Tax=Bifidobacterium aerophilum TaxID=1798155 RepID=A0A6N9Z8W5_9BIFI|nr:5-formyltetrahydrofolate cyclo-ligase [Bifidobacterium aerophilum]NEG90533.1 5-formyltetrahydrofolate cyclo-ligase [Bifidobacterium aerophilum]